jgi:hypothetical protein
MFAVLVVKKYKQENNIVKINKHTKQSINSKNKRNTQSKHI